VGSVLEAMKIALDVEKKGYRLYMEAAAKTKNKLGRATLEAIAAKEIDHIKNIENYCQQSEEALEKTRKNVREIKHRDKIDYVRSILEKIGAQLEEKIKADADLVETYRVAMELERESYNFYQKLKEEADEAGVKEFLEFLMKEENNHYEILQETLEYLDHPGDWFREQERWIVEG
jgi:rubrerythrin